MSDAHKNLGTLLSAAGDLPQACYHFETALRLEPRLVAARYHYALALARMRRFDAAQEQVRRLNAELEQFAYAVSHDLQDEIAQTLLAINVRLWTLKKVNAVNAKGFKKEIASTQRLVDKSVRSINRFARELSLRHET